MPLADQPPDTAPLPSTDQGRAAVVVWIVALGIAGLVALLIVVDLVRRTLQSPRVDLSDGWMLSLLAGAAAGVSLFVYGLRVRAMQRIIEDTPTSTTRALPLGFVEVAGVAEPDGQPLSSPLSNQPCVFYHYRIQERRGDGRSKRWETVAEERSAEPFYLQDRTGRVLIVPMGADTRLSREQVFSNYWPGALPDHVAFALRRIGEPTASWLGPRTLRCREAYLAPGDPLYVLGTAQENPAATGDDAARVYIGQHQDHRFLIADRSEKALLARLKLLAAGCLYGGPLLTALSIALWVMRKGS